MAEPETLSHDDAPNAEGADQRFAQKMFGRLRGDRLVERHEITRVVPRLREQIDALLGRGDERRLLTRPQKRRGMIRERERGGAPTEFAKPNRLTREVAVAAVHAVEESNRQHQRFVRIAPELVQNLHTNTFRGASKAPCASPTPTSVRDSSRTKTCLPPAPAGSGTTRPARKSEEWRRSSTIVGNGMMNSGAMSAAAGSAAISSIVRLSYSKNGPEPSRTSAPMCAGTPIARPRSSHSVRTYVPSLHAIRRRAAPSSTPSSVRP